MRIFGTLPRFIFHYNPWDVNNKIVDQKDGQKFNQKPNKSGGEFDFFSFFENQKNLIIILLAIVGLIWLFSGFYVINQNEQGVITRFGKYVRTSEPGLHIKLPYPMEKLYKLQTKTIHKIQMGSGGSSLSTREDGYKILMLTGDENIVDADFEVQWRIKNPNLFLFNIAKPQDTIRSTLESAMRDVVGRTKISLILSTGRYAIEQDVKFLAQQILDSYNSGIDIVLVQMLRVDPPEQVIDSFRDVQTAKADKERKINQAQAYYNSIIPKTQGEVDKITQEAMAYKNVVVAEAEGKAKRFVDIYRQYQTSKDITKKRIYLETMEKIISNNDVIIVDKNSASILPYFNIDKKLTNSVQKNE